MTTRLLLVAALMTPANSALGEPPAPIISISTTKNAADYVELMGQTLILDLQPKIKQLYQTFHSIPAPQGIVGISFRNETSSIVCPGTTNPLVAQIRSEVVRKIIDAPSDKESIDQVITYYGCNGESLFSERIYLEGTKLSALSTEQALFVERLSNEPNRIFSLQPNETRRFYSISDASSKEVVLSIDSLLRYPEAVETIVKISANDVTRILSYPPRPGIKQIEIYRNAFSYSTRVKGGIYTRSTDLQLRLKVMQGDGYPEYRSDWHSQDISEAIFDTEFSRYFREDVAKDHLRGLLNAYLKYFPESQAAPVPSKLKEELLLYRSMILQSTISNNPDLLKATLIKIYDWLQLLILAVDGGLIKDARP